MKPVEHHQPAPSMVEIIPSTSFYYQGALTWKDEYTVLPANQAAKLTTKEHEDGQEMIDEQRMIIQRTRIFQGVNVQPIQAIMRAWYEGSQDSEDGDNQDSGKEGEGNENRKKKLVTHSRDVMLGK